MEHLNGWVFDAEASERIVKSLPMPAFGAAAPHLLSGDEQQTLLYKAWKDGGDGYPDDPAQQIGCCVSRGYASGVDLLAATEICTGKENEVYKRTSHEAIYGMARIDIGKGQLGREAGAMGAWAAKAVNTLGTVSREVVGPYSDARAQEWGYRGVPAEIKSKASNQKVRTVSLVLTWEELEAAIRNGYPVPVCSDQGFTMVRDADGFCTPEGIWNHCMLICGIRLGSRPGACILQSWGPKTPSGPTTLDQPLNSFWADKRVVSNMLRMQDSFALSGFDGYPGQKLPDSWNYDGFA